MRRISICSVISTPTHAPPITNSAETRKYAYNMHVDTDVLMDADADGDVGSGVGRVQLVYEKQGSR
jgi:uncharacterized protein YqkB